MCFVQQLLRIGSVTVKYFIMACILIPGPIVYAQEKLTLGSNVCEFDSTMVILGDKTVWIFSPDNKAKEVLRKLMRFVGVSGNFKLMAADVPTASAVILNSNRYILYRQDWILNLVNQAGTYWAEVGIIAHEIGHHLEGHTLVLGETSHKDELDADVFAGKLMRRMGATLPEAQSAFRSTNEMGAERHPPRAARLAAVTNGWVEEEQLNKDRVAEKAKLTSVYPELPLIPLPENETSMRSGPGLVKTSIRFDNRTQTAIQIHWLDPSGKRKTFCQLEVGEACIMDTYENHYWIASDQKGDALALFLAEPGVHDAILREKPSIKK